MIGIFSGHLLFYCNLSGFQFFNLSLLFSNLILQLAYQVVQFGYGGVAFVDTISTFAYFYGYAYIVSVISAGKAGSEAEHDISVRTIECAQCDSILSIVETACGCEIQLVCWIIVERVKSCQSADFCKSFVRVGCQLIDTLS